MKSMWQSNPSESIILHNFLQNRLFCTIFFILRYVDTLTNVNIEDDERTKKSHQNVKDFKEGYKAYDSEVIDEHTGEVKSSAENICFNFSL